MYLSGGDGDKIEGGHTLFPCLRPANRTAADASIGVDGSISAVSGNGAEATCRTLALGLAQGRRTNPSNNPWHKGSLEESDRLCHEAAEEGASKVVAAAPVRGSALLFASRESVYGAELPETWHRGCYVRSGHKMIYTRFKAHRASAVDHRADYEATWPPVV
mmetsp:Transcript_29980/g.67242  ORF Transcript_29980/g.67242 Transcript_29980/m.67242 type:complete len:162 (-) Transcript_29980:146-631(-)